LGKKLLKSFKRIRIAKQKRESLRKRKFVFGAIRNRKAFKYNKIERSLDLRIE
jgi:hypothetical protein